jgi:hypothetical protein
MVFYSADRQVPSMHCISLHVKHCTRTHARFEGVVGQAVTETLVSHISYRAFRYCLAQGMEVFVVAEQISLLLSPTKSICDKKLDDISE